MSQHADPAKTPLLIDYTQDRLVETITSNCTKTYAYDVVLIGQISCNTNHGGEIWVGIAYYNNWGHPNMQHFTTPIYLPVKAGQEIKIANCIGVSLQVFRL